MTEKKAKISVKYFTNLRFALAKIHLMAYNNDADGN